MIELETEWVKIEQEGVGRSQRLKKDNFQTLRSGEVMND